MESKVLFVVLLYAFNCLQLVASSPVTEDRANYLVGAGPATRLPGDHESTSSLSQNNVAANQQQIVDQNNRNLHLDSYQDQGIISRRSAFQGNTDPNHVLVEKLRKILLQRLNINGARSVSAINEPLVQKQVAIANNNQRKPAYEIYTLRSQISAGSNQQIQSVTERGTIGSSQISERKHVPQVASASNDNKAVNFQKTVQQNINVSRIQLNQQTNANIQQNNQQNSAKQTIDANENLRRLEQIDQNARLTLNNRQLTFQKDKPRPSSTSQRNFNQQFQLQTSIADKLLSVKQNGYNSQQYTSNATPPPPNFKEINTVINQKVFAQNNPTVRQDDSKITNNWQVRNNKPLSINPQSPSLQTVSGTNAVTFKRQNARKPPGSENFNKQSQQQVFNPSTPQNLAFQNKKIDPYTNKNVYQQATNGQQGIVQKNINAGQEDAKIQRNLSDSQNIPTSIEHRNFNEPKENTVRQNIYSQNPEVRNRIVNNFQKAQNMQGNINNLKQEYRNTRQTGLKVQKIIKNLNLRKTEEEMEQKRQEVDKIKNLNIQPNYVLAFGNNGFQTSVASTVAGPTKSLPIIIQPKVLQTNPTIVTPTSEVVILTTTNIPETVTPKAVKYKPETQKLPENYESAMLVETTSVVPPITMTSLLNEIDNTETITDPYKSTDDQSTPAAINKDSIIPTTENSRESVEVMSTTAVQSSDKPGDQNLSEPKKPVIFVDQSESEDDEDYKPAPPIWFNLSDSDFMKKLLPPDGGPLIACFFQVPSSDNDDKPQEDEKSKPPKKE